MLTPEGKTSKYIYGIDYGPRDLRLALVEASDHKVGTPVDRLLLYCYHYDPATGKYGLVLMNVLRLAGVVTVVCIGGFILIMRRREAPATARRPTSRRRTNPMWSLPLFPTGASTMAGKVDALYFFLVAVSAFFVILIATLIVVFGVRYRRRARGDVGAKVDPGARRSRSPGPSSRSGSAW